MFITSRSTMDFEDRHNTKSSDEEHHHYKMKKNHLAWKLFQRLYKSISSGDCKTATLKTGVPPYSGFMVSGLPVQMSTLKLKL
jgi:hypothetical protein